MTPLTVDEIRDLLPEVDSVGPLIERILASARPDGSRKWTVSGELETLGDRVPALREVADQLPELLESVRAHLEQLYREVLEALECLSRDDPEGSAQHLLGAAQLERSVGRLRQAGAFTESAVRLTARFRIRERALPIFFAGARIARTEGRWREAEHRYREAGRIAAATEDAPSAARAGVGLGNLAIDRGLWQLALQRFQDAERWVKAAREPLPERWHLPLNRSIVAREEGRIHDAERELERARSLAPGGEAEAEAILRNARGQLLRDRGRVEEAELAFREALGHAAAADAQVTISSNLADALLAQGRFLEAGEVARTAEETALSNSVVSRLPEVYSLLGRVAEARGHADAFVFFERALEIVDARKLPELERARILEAYASYLLGKGDEEAAAAYRDRAVRIYRTLEYESAVQRLESPGGEEEGKW